MNSTQYYLYIAGQQHFLMAAAEIRGKIFEPSMETEGWEYTKDFLIKRKELKLNTRPTACAGTTSLGVVAVFLLGYLAEKVSDEFYERIAKRPVSTFISALINQFDIPDKKHIEYRDVVSFKDSNAIVVVRLIFTGPMTTDANEALNITHKIAHRYIVDNGVKAPIHCYNIINGKIPDSPDLYISLDQIDKGDSTKIANFRNFKL